MKQPKKLTRYQKAILASQGLVPDSYMLVSESEFYLTVMHKLTKKISRVDNYLAGGKKK